jgi:hypothetical protein
MGFTRHLAENAVGDIVVAAPIGGAFGIGELVHVMAAQLLGQTRGLAVNRARAVRIVALPAQRLDGGDFFRRRAARHHRDKGQAQHPRKVSLGHSVEPEDASTIVIPCAIQPLHSA